MCFVKWGSKNIKKKKPQSKAFLRQRNVKKEGLWLLACVSLGVWKETKWESGDCGIPPGFKFVGQWS